MKDFFNKYFYSNFKANIIINNYRRDVIMFFNKSINNNLYNIITIEFEKIDNKIYINILLLLLRNKERLKKTILLSS